MDFSVCTQCGVEIESKGIHFRNHVFCSDECCEKFEDRVRNHVDPDAVELEKADALADDGLFDDEYLGDGEDDDVDEDQGNGDY